MVKFTRLSAIGITAALTLTLGGTAQATEFGFKGSDTLFEIMTDAVAAYKTELGLSNPATQDFVKYLGTGSGNAEKAMATHNAANAPWQRIGPMSRNLTTAAQTTCDTRVGAGNCAPEQKNVLGLDAGVLVLGAGSGVTACPNVQVGKQTDGSALSDNTLALILGGKGGTGDWVACSSPERVQAINSLLGCQVGLGNFSHFFRRDDSSGTSDTMRDKLHVSRFCNGSHKPPAGSLNGNLVGPDNDPIRTACPAPSTNTKPVRCTVTDPGSANYLKDCSAKRCSGGTTFGGFTYAAGFLACTADADCAALGAGTCTTGLDPNEPGCTAGFLVSLSDGDNAGVPDVTMTIAARIVADNTAMGYAGREAIRKATPLSSQPAKGARLNTNQSSDLNVRGDQYLLSRRLFLQDTCDQGGAAVTDATGVAGRDAAECQFFQWATDELPSISAKSGRENLDPIMKKWGFLPCTDDFSTPSGDGNLCSKGYLSPGFAPGADAPSVCVINARTTAGWQPTVATTGTDICCSDGLVANTHLANTCPVPAKRITGAACAFDADCVNGACDLLGTSTTGTCN